MLRWGTVIGALLLLEGRLGGQVAAQNPPADRWVVSGSWRVREEAWNWFGTGTGRGRYDFIGSLLRVGLLRATKTDDILVELAQPSLFNLPKTATLPAPRGQLGLGAAYYDASGNQETSLFLKQAFWKIKKSGDPATFLRAGRFEFVDGMETTPADPTLAWLKRERVAHRILGNFGWSHVGRSFDGLQYVQNAPRLNVTAFGGLPTEGVFQLKGNDTLEGVKVGYLALTAPLPSKVSPGEARLFGAYYEDARSGVTKTDNRPAAVRAADGRGIRIETVGGHYLRVLPVGGGRVDALAWAAGQFGTWGTQSHEALAYAVELGYQPDERHLKPWLRVGFFHADGDDDPGDNKHGTFFPMLFTPRIYARFPFYTLSNLDDAFVMLILRPHPQWTVRTDYHRLSLAARNDLWYAGGGAFQERPSFGYAGRPSGGFGSLASLLDLSVDYQWTKRMTLSLYLAWAEGGNVIRNLFPGRSAALGYVEVLHRW